MDEVKRFCPVCGEEVKGSKKNKYFCKKCDLLFKEEDVVIKKDADGSVEKM
jgi:tRNA(Ile2) C34 agmatinyltransferase TiaS